jgi:hypothetical protein
VERVANNNPAIISDATPRWRSSWTWLVLAATATAGAGAAVYYAALGLTLSHYDARAHIVVARRIADSLTPGWRQFGAIWLPLPHALNAPFVWMDWNYRTGFSGVMISVLALSIGLTAITRFIHARTGSLAAALSVPAIVLMNPNVLYLQSTPMTEPLLFGLSLLAVVTVDAWLRDFSTRSHRMAGITLAALVMTRYEGWFIAAALLGVALISRRGQRIGVVRLAAYPGVAIGTFLVLSWAATGVWFVTSGFFVPDNPAWHRPVAVLVDVLEATVTLGSRTLVLVAIAGAVACLLASRRTLASLTPLSLLAAACLPIAAFYEGHPYRVRYMVPLVVAAGVLSAFALAHVSRTFRGWATVTLLVTVWIQRPPLDGQAPMVLEAQWETPFRLGRAAVTRHLDENYDGEPILASMGSLAHYMQEASSHGLRLDHFVHEGNGDLWTAALEDPRRHVSWVMIEERAEGGDQLAARARSDSSFLSGFARAADGGGLVLYRRAP